VRGCQRRQPRADGAQRGTSIQAIPTADRAPSCRVTVAEHPAGGDWIVLAQVEDARLAPGKEPLVVFAGGLSTVSSR
jgi:hypothetical protein